MKIPLYFQSGTFRCIFICKRGSYNEDHYFLHSLSIEAQMWDMLAKPNDLMNIFIYKYLHLYKIMEILLLKMAHEIVSSKNNRLTQQPLFPCIISSTLSSSGYLFWLLLYFSFLGSPYALHLLFFYFNMVQSIISHQDRCRNMEEDKTE